ncbi:hypothetical protein V1477_016770 [Vespula maculifrons]|uniref:Uncharacterized protein n=1 Tax=Vespula maculifrons TaxID=7453 RepID=A0ABD2B430_VESMC
MRKLDRRLESFRRKLTPEETNGLTNINIRRDDPFFFLFFFSCSVLLILEKDQTARDLSKKNCMGPGLSTQTGVNSRNLRRHLLVLKDNSLISYDWSYVVAWVGVGWSLISAILFSAAAICLRGERMREEAMNMQYLMPVYPQKQQYAYAGYPAPAAYPGPYYHGSQYGPYNY